MSETKYFGKTLESIILYRAEIESGDIVNITAQDARVCKRALFNTEEIDSCKVKVGQRNQSVMQYNCFNQVSKNLYNHNLGLYYHVPERDEWEVFEK
jgi:hypothetical protein